MYVALLGMGGCSGKPEFGVTNRSSQQLTNIVISGAGFNERIDSLASGEKTSFIVRPTGDSGIRVSFNADGERIDAAEQGFVSKGSHHVAILIKADLTVSVSVELRL